jgi:hypothetical protein
MPERTCRLELVVFAKISSFAAIDKFEEGVSALKILLPTVMLLFDPQSIR